MIPVLIGEPAGDLEIDRKRLGAFRVDGPNVPAHRAYLRGRLLQRSARHDEAVAEFDKVIGLDSSLPEPFQRLVESLTALSSTPQTEVRLRRVLERGKCDADAWDAWFRLAAVELGRSAAELLESFPALEEELTGRGADIRWSLERMATRDGVIRLNCGGPDYVGQDGKHWDRDRFFPPESHGSSRRVPIEIARTDDDLLYQTERHFVARPRLARSGYQVPLPAGRYEVTLHFAEIYYPRRGMRIFDVIVEGEKQPFDYEPLRTGFAIADQMDFELSVEDGFLDIELHPKTPVHAGVSAIEISRCDDE